MGSYNDLLPKAAVACACAACQNGAAWSVGNASTQAANRRHAAAVAFVLSTSMRNANQCLLYPRELPWHSLIGASAKGQWTKPLAR